jgi:F-type H+-transporting ATPase subunit a
VNSLLMGLAAAQDKYEPHAPYPFFFEDKLWQIDNVVVGQWFAMAILVTMAFLVSRNVQKVPRTRIQGLFEILFNFLEGWLASFLGSRKYARKYLPLLGTFFMFILVMNYSGLVPGAGEHWFYYPATGVWGTTAGLAICVALVVQWVAIKEMGVVGWIKHLLHLGPLSILEEFVRPFSLSLRLFGNIFGEEILLGVIIFLTAGFLAPIPIMGLAMMFGAIQAVVFTTLTAIYIGGVLEAAHHHH